MASGCRTQLQLHSQCPDMVTWPWHCDHSHVQDFSQHSTLNTSLLNEYPINKKNVAILEYVPDKMLDNWGYKNVKSSRRTT